MESIPDSYVLLIMDVKEGEEIVGGSEKILLVDDEETILECLFFKGDEICYLEQKLVTLNL